MNLAKAAQQLEALGNQTRLAIYRNLIQAGPQGNHVGAIRAKLDIPASTLSHHIAKLMHAGLLTQERESRNLICKADFTNMDALLTFMVQNCCGQDSCFTAQN